ncbi:biopolymer transporter ExbD [bacterium]|nr:biopolymer transporter ExbD [bacterium]
MKLDIAVARKPRMEMFALIDVIFQLLVFFIYAMISMSTHYGLQVKLPSSTIAEIDRKQPLSVTIKSKGDIYLNKKPVSLDALTTILRKSPAVAKSQGVLLFADNSVSYDRLFKVMERIRTAGVQNISLQAEKKLKR